MLPPPNSDLSVSAQAEKAAGALASKSASLNPYAEWSKKILEVCLGLAAINGVLGMIRMAIGRVHMPDYLMITLFFLLCVQFLVACSADLLALRWPLILLSLAAEDLFTAKESASVRQVNEISQHVQTIEREVDSATGVVLTKHASGIVIPGPRDTTDVRIAWDRCDRSTQQFLHRACCPVLLLANVQ